MQMQIISRLMLKFTVVYPPSKTEPLRLRHHNHASTHTFSMDNVVRHELSILGLLLELKKLWRTVTEAIWRIKG